MPKSPYQALTGKKPTPSAASNTQKAVSSITEQEYNELPFHIQKDLQEAGMVVPALVGAAVGHLATKALGNKKEDLIFDKPNKETGVSNKKEDLSDRRDELKQKAQTERDNTEQENNAETQKVQQQRASDEEERAQEKLEKERQAEIQQRIEKEVSKQTSNKQEAAWVLPAAVGVAAGSLATSALSNKKEELSVAQQLKVSQDYMKNRKKYQQGDGYKQNVKDAQRNASNKPKDTRSSQQRSNDSMGYTKKSSDRDIRRGD